MLTYFEYLDFNGAQLFTCVCLPKDKGKFPTVILRSPYVDFALELSEGDVSERVLNENKAYLENGYAVVFQHCRGCGKSTGEFVPYIFEREDGLFLQGWIRNQQFYNGELYLVGGSYTASVHYVTAPFAPDIKGAVFEVQDSERYNCNYRNGIYKMGLHGEWYIQMYKKKSIKNKSFVLDSYNTLPLCDMSRSVLGQSAPEFDEVLNHPNKDDEFWQTRNGGSDARGAINNAKIPILLTTGAFDLYTGGVFDMWNSLDKETKEMSALLVHPYDHGGTPMVLPFEFENGRIKEKYGEFMVSWLNHIRLGGKAPFEVGKVTYYKLFDTWYADDFAPTEKAIELTLGSKEVTYCYNPYAPATFKGGLSANFGGTAYQDPPNSRYDIVSVYTDEFENDLTIKGKMAVRLRVKSTAADTCFYVRISLAKPQGDLGLRDDINQISNLTRSYIPNEEVEMTFSFDELACLVHKGEKLRIDISSSAFPHYVRHTNNKGLFSKQETAKIAYNTVVLEKSKIIIPIED